jgi:serine/threonine protein kinase
MSSAANTDLGPTPPGESSGEAQAREEREERAALDARVGLQVADRYKILRTLGAGGMGGVYEAVHEGIGRKVAIKCLHAEYARDRALVERFRREARAATAIGNEHIVDVTDVGELPDGAPFLVMEYLVGKTLGQMLNDSGPLRVPRAIHICRQVCSALDAAHEKGIVHRDLKPDNIFLIKRGGDPDFVKVLDFGISKTHAADNGVSELTRTGMAIGTPSYMSPEQAQGLRDIDGRTDVWAMGVILYELLSHRRPFVAETYPRLLMQIVGGTPHRLSHWRRDIPDGLDALVMKCLEKEPAQRVSSMAALGEALGEFEKADSVPELAAADASGAPLAEQSSEREAAKRVSATSDTPPAPQAAAAAPRGPDETARAAAQASPSVPETTAAAGSRAPWIAAGLAITVVLAVGAAWSMRGGETPPTSAPPATVTTTPATTTPPATTTAPPEGTDGVEVPTTSGTEASPTREVHHRIESRPAGATVLRGETELGTTPLDVSFPEGESVELTLRLAGRRPATRVVATNDPEVISVTLEPRRAGPSLPQLADH